MRRDDSAAKEEKNEIDFTAQKANFFRKVYFPPFHAKQYLCILAEITSGLFNFCRIYIECYMRYYYSLLNVSFYIFRWIKCTNIKMFAN